MLRLDQALSFEQMRTVAPSIFAGDETKHETKTWSDKYDVVPTCEVLRRLATYGFGVFMVGQSTLRDAAERVQTRHMVRLRHDSFRRPDAINEVILLSSDRVPSTYQLLAGVYRLASCNALVCGTTMREVRVRQSGDVLKDVIEGVLQVVEDFSIVDAERAAMQALWLQPSDQVAFARSARSLAWDDPDIPPPVTEQQLLHVERGEDHAPDLWTTFSRVQEHLTKGGMRGHRPDGRRAVTRAIRAIDQNVKVNRALWLLAGAFLELKVE